ncbi:MAG: c-type heme family protein [Planctomycetaceae bacterium]
MRRKLGGMLLLLAFALGLIFQAIGDEPAKPAVDATKSKEAEPTGRVSLETAKDRAVVLQDAYLEALDVIHERYFHGDRAIVPARAMEDVFARVGRRNHSKARWISVNTKAMSVHHEPSDDFEKRAADEIADGKETVEAVEGDLYRRAVAIPLAEGCVQCHSLGGLSQSKTPRYAGLVINIPIHPASEKSTSGK